MFYSTIMSNFEIAFLKTHTKTGNRFGSDFGKKWITNDQLMTASVRLKGLYLLTQTDNNKFVEFYKTYNQYYKKMVANARLSPNSRLMNNSSNKTKTS